MLDNGFKLEVEALISKDISYVTEQYTPAAAEGEGLAGLTSSVRLDRRPAIAVAGRLHVFNCSRRQPAVFKPSP